MVQGGPAPPERTHKAARLIVTLATAAPHVALHLALVGRMGNATGILALAPVLVAAACFGLRGGVAAGLLSLPLISVLVLATTDEVWIDWLVTGGILGSVALVTVGAAVGRLRDLQVGIRREEDARVRAERESLSMEQAALSQFRLATLSQVVAAVEQEIREPLSHVMTTLRALRQRSEEPVGVALTLNVLDQAISHAEHVDRVLDHLRGLSQETGAELTEVDMMPVLEGALMLLGERIRSARIAVEQEVAPNLPRVRGNHRRLEQVFLNIFQNAIEALGPAVGTPRIRVSLAQSIDGRDVVATLSDNGMGIDWDDAESVFEPFHTTKHGEPAGLGLWIARTIVLAHGGGKSPAGPERAPRRRSRSPSRPRRMPSPAEPARPPATRWPPGSGSRAARC